MTERFRVRVEKDEMVFSSGHFITFDGQNCERLHGHNYRAGVEVEAKLDENHYVFDFIALKNRMRELTLELDHRMLVATQNPYLAVTESPKSVRIAFREKEWIFPREDCLLLPIGNTTSEMLAKYLAGRLIEWLENEKKFFPEIVRVDVEECFGQIAIYEWRQS